MFLEELSLVDPLTSSTVGYYETANWTKMSWATGVALIPNAPGVRFSGFSETAFNGGYFNGTSFIKGAATINYVSGGFVEKRFFALWLNLNGSTHSGYRFKFEDQLTAKKMKIKLFSVSSGVETSLGESAEIEPGETGVEYGVWNNSGNIEAYYKPKEGAWTKALSVANAVFSTGNIGLEGTGSNPGFTNLKAASSAGAVVGKFWPARIIKQANARSSSF
jgi:hypothetical protein